MRTLKQYHFERNDFLKVFAEVFGDRMSDVEIACQEQRSTDSFLLYYKEDEFYIIHLESGTIINWYKHLGRTNTCNDESFYLSDFRTFLTLLREELINE
jgi:hypothetical protein